MGAAFRAPTSTNAIDVTSTDTNALNWNANLVAQGINGYLNWTDNSFATGLSGGKVIARLTELTIPKADFDSVGTGLLDINPRDVPALDIAIDQLTVGDRVLGKVALQASNQMSTIDAARRNWVIDTLSIANPNFSATATGQWQREKADAKPTVRLNINATTESLGDALASMGAVGVISASPGSLDAQLQWTGSPFALDVPSLSGTLNANFGKGQFLKVDPGAGRLVGLFSLQSIPKRLTLDFRDMFATGFAFDRVQTTATLVQGQLKLDTFNMKGLAADVNATGSVSLTEETQDLRFIVRPDVNAGGVSLLYVLINPPIGLGTLALQWLFREPLRKQLTVEYAVTGAWASPKTEQVKRALE